MGHSYIALLACLVCLIALTQSQYDNQAGKNVSTVTITNIGGPTSYQDVTSYACSNTNQLVCNKVTRNLPSSCVGQFQDDFAYIFRGPMDFKFIGVFEPANNSWDAQGWWEKTPSAKVWGQSGYGPAQQGLAFTGNLGKFSMCNGYEQSYLSGDGLTSSPTSATFQGSLPNEINMQVMKDEKCDDSCGYYEGVGLKGWQGKAPGYSRMFVHVATMPDPTKSPASWLLNGRLVRTRQYGSCTCYSGQAGQPTCGELDMFEVIEELALKDQVSTTIYMTKGRMGDRGSYTFKRSYDQYKTYITIIHEDGYIQILQLEDDDWKYGLSITNDQVNQWLQKRELIMVAPGTLSPPECKAPVYHNFPSFPDTAGFTMVQDPNGNLKYA